MISIPQPALALNSTDFPAESHYTMRYTEHLTRMTRVETIIDIVGRRVDEAGGRLEALIINAHGMYAPDGVALGTGMHLGNTHLWGELAGTIGRIWLCACEVADTAAGAAFCQSLAAAAATEVIGAIEEQRVGADDREFSFEPSRLRFFRIPPGEIDEFEGPVFLWNADGVRAFDPHG